LAACQAYLISFTKNHLCMGFDLVWSAGVGLWAFRSLIELELDDALSGSLMNYLNILILNLKNILCL
jgi:hypothetical protein